VAPTYILIHNSHQAVAKKDICNSQHSAANDTHNRNNTAPVTPPSPPPPHPTAQPAGNQRHKWCLDTAAVPPPPITTAIEPPSTGTFVRANSSAANQRHNCRCDTTLVPPPPSGAPTPKHSLLQQHDSCTTTAATDDVMHHSHWAAGASSPSKHTPSQPQLIASLM
jgi:hypothetical protein